MRRLLPHELYGRVDGVTDARLLSNREKEVATLLLNAKSRKEIAYVLGITPRTVDAHVRTLYLKLGVHSAAELFLLNALLKEAYDKYRDTRKATKSSE